MTSILNHIRERSLDVMSTGSPISSLLAEFALALQAVMPDGTLIGITIVDQPGRTFRHASFPSLPDTFVSRICGKPITDKRGSCGMAIITGRPVESQCVADDTRFSAEWRALFDHHELLSIVSTPALTPDGQAQGCIAAIRRWGPALQPCHRALLDEAASVCARIGVYSRTRETAEVINGELQHRIRNLYSTIGAMATLTQRNHPEPAQFRTVLDQRLVMMQRAQSLALSEQQTDMSSLIREVMAPYVADFAIKISGPEIMLAGEAASAIALVAHELGTNAAKYGSLSRQGGGLRIEWSIATEKDTIDKRIFNLNWIETGGPQVTQPTRKGYGTLMINSSLRNAFDAAAVMTYEPAGFSCMISAPLTPKLGVFRAGEVSI